MWGKSLKLTWQLSSLALGNRAWSCLSAALVTERILWGEEAAQSDGLGEWTRVSPAQRPRRDQGWAGTEAPFFPLVGAAFQGLSGAGCSPGSSEALPGGELPCLGALAV